LKYRKNTQYFCLLFLVFLMAQGCAIVDKKNRRALNLLDDVIQIESTAGKICAAPIIVPVGTGAGLLDMIVVHPIVSVPKAADDTLDLIWRDPQGSDFRQILIFVPKLIVTPFYFSGDWVLRVLFPID